MIGNDTADYLKAWSDEGISINLIGKDGFGKLKAGAGDLDAVGLVQAMYADEQEYKREQKRKEAEAARKKAKEEAKKRAEANKNAVKLGEGAQLGDLDANPITDFESQKYNEAFAKAGINGISFDNNFDSNDESLGSGIFEQKTDVALNDEEDKPIITGICNPLGIGKVMIDLAHQYNKDYQESVKEKENQKLLKELDVDIAQGKKEEAIERMQEEHKRIKLTVVENAKTAKKVIAENKENDIEISTENKLDSNISNYLDLDSKIQGPEEPQQSAEEIWPEGSYMTVINGRLVNVGQIVVHDTSSNFTEELISEIIATKILDLKDKPYANNVIYKKGDKSFPYVAGVGGIIYDGQYGRETQGFIKVPIGAGHTGNNIHSNNPDPLKAADCSGGARYAINEALKIIGYKPVADGDVNDIMRYSLKPVITYEQDSEGPRVDINKVEETIKKYSKPGYLIVYGRPHERGYRHITVYRGTINGQQTVSHASNRQRPGYLWGRNYSNYPLSFLTRYYAGRKNKQAYKIAVYKIDSSKLKQVSRR